VAPGVGKPKQPIGTQINAIQAMVELQCSREPPGERHRGDAVHLLAAGHFALDMSARQIAVREP